MYTDVVSLVTCLITNIASWREFTDFFIFIKKTFILVVCYVLLLKVLLSIVVVVVEILKSVVLV